MEKAVVEIMSEEHETKLKKADS